MIDDAGSTAKNIPEQSVASLVVFNDTAKRDVSATLESLEAVAPGQAAVIITPLPLELSPPHQNRHIIKTCYDDYFSIFDALKETLELIDTEYCLILRAGATLDSQELKGNADFTWPNGINFCSTREKISTQLINSDSPTSLSELLSRPILPWALCLDKVTYQSIGGIKPEQLHFCFWELLIRYHSSRPFLSVPELEGIVNIKTSDMNLSPIDSYYSCIEQFNPELLKDLRDPTHEWCDLQSTLYSMVVDSNRELFAERALLFLPKLEAEITRQKLARINPIWDQEIGERTDSGKLQKFVCQALSGALVKTSRTIGKIIKSIQINTNRLFSRDPKPHSDGPLNILFLTSHSPFDEVTGAIAAGAEIAMRQIAEMLAKRGHKVHYLTFGDKLKMTTSINGVTVHFYPSQKTNERGIFWGKLLSLLKSFSKWCSNRNSHSFLRQISPELNKFITWADFYFWNYRRYILKTVRDRNIEVIHCFSSMPDSLAAALVSNKTGVPMSIRMGGRFWYLKYFATKRKSRKTYLEHLDYVFRCTDLFAFNSEALQEQTRDMLAELDLKIHSRETVVDIGVQLPQIAEKESLSLPDFKDKFVICCIGKFKKNSKRQDVLISALKYLPKDGIQVVFAGGGPTEDDMKNLAESEGVSSSVTFLGNITREQVFQLINASDVFAHPTDFEGSSKAVAEAMLCGKCVVASDIPALREHIAHEKNGLLVKNSPKLYAREIERLYNKEELREELSKNAWLYAEEHFNPEKNVLEYEELFLQLATSSIQTSHVKNFSRNPDDLSFSK